MPKSNQWKIYEYPLTIREHHLDSFGHVNNAVYLELFEEARWEIITQNGYGYQRVHELKVGPVILELQMQFKRELSLRKNIIIRTQVLSQEDKIGVLVQEMLDDKGQVCCHAEFKVALFDMKARRIVPPTEDWLRAIGKL
jgi:acyl-CoA thioester hydrolase